MIEGINEEFQYFTNLTVTCSKTAKVVLILIYFMFR